MTKRLRRNSSPVRCARRDISWMRCAPSTRQAQRGQVIPLTLVFLTALTLSLWVLYDAGQVNIEKMKLQNNADAAAYSAATLVARDLNFIAYTNRAMVANQVAIGQTVGLVSWVNMMEQVASNMDMAGDVLRYVPYVGTIIDGITTWLETTMEYVQTGVENAAPIMIKANDLVIQAMAEAQRTYHLATIAAAVEVLGEVTKANDPNARQIASMSGVSLASVATMVQELNKMMGGVNQIQRPSTTSNSKSNTYQLGRFKELQSVVIASEDPFTYRRSYSWSWGSVPVVPGVVWFEMPKYGGSEFDYRKGSDGKYKWEWTAMDDVSFQWSMRYVDWKGVHVKHWEVPFGWGAAHALNSDTQSSYFNYFANTSKSRYGKGTWKNGAAAKLAAKDDGSNNYEGVTKGGLRQFYDFKEDGTGYDRGPAVTVLLAKDDQHLQTQKAMDQNSNGFNVNAAQNSDIYIEQYGGTNNQHVTALSKAEPYFYRPHEKNGTIDTWLRSKMSGLDSKLGPAKVPNGAENQFEHGNLYGPFWQARLTDTSDTERLAAIGLSELF